MRLANKVCVITGGGSGIGEATCLLFAREGGRVVAADKNLATAQRTADRVLQEGGQALAWEVDVSLSDSVEKMVQATVDKFGRLDVLVNNAGYGFAATVVETEESDWDQLIDVNLKGVYLGCKFAIPVMRRHGGDDSGHGPGPCGGWRTNQQHCSRLRRLPLLQLDLRG